MAEEDDDFLDLCDESSSSPLPVYNAAKHIEESDKRVTILSSDIESDSLENYSDFESDDSSSIRSPKQDKKGNRQLNSAKCDSNSSSDEIIVLSSEKGNQIFTYSPNKPQTCSSSAVNINRHASHSKTISDSCKGSTQKYSTGKSLSQSENILEQSTELVKSIFKPHDKLNKILFSSNSDKSVSGNNCLGDAVLAKTDDNAKHEKRFQLVKSDTISTGSSSKSSGEITETEKIKQKTWSSDPCVQHAMLNSMEVNKNKKKESTDRDQWIKMSKWHTKEDTGSPDVTQSAKCSKRKRPETHSESEEDSAFGSSEDLTSTKCSKRKQPETDSDSESEEDSTLTKRFWAPSNRYKLLPTAVPKRKQTESNSENEEDISPPKKYKTIETDGVPVSSKSQTTRMMKNRMDPKTALETLKKTLEKMESMKQKTSNTDVCSNKIKTVTTVVKAAVKLKEMFPNLTASQIGSKVRNVNDGIMTEEELVQRVVEDIYNTDDNTEDIQIALANPKIKTQQCTKSTGQAKNRTTNSTKGKSLMKKVPKPDCMDIDMTIASDTDIEEVTISRLEAIDVLEPNNIKLRWDCVPSLPNDTKNLRFIIEMQTPPAKEWKSVAKEVAGKVYVVKNLNPGNDYNFRVRARIGFCNVFDPSPVASVRIRASDVKVPDVKPDQNKAPATITKPSQDQTPIKVAPPMEEEVSSSTLSCEACQAITTLDKMVQCCDGHLNCNLCVEKEVKKILSHGSEETNISCGYTAWYECNSTIPESQVKKVLPSLVFELLEDKLNKKASETIEKMTDLYSCPSCKFKVFIEGDLKKFDCPECKVEVCRYCGKVWNETSDHAGCTLNTFMASCNSDSTSVLSTLPEGFKDFASVELNQEMQSELSFVLTLFQKDTSGRKNKTPISRIFRVHNPKLWQKYCLAKEHMIADIGKDNINEQHLFHGTSTKAIGGICREGLDWRMCGENGTAFGQGTYFAKNSSYSIKYAHLGTCIHRRKKPNVPFGFANAPLAPTFTFGNSQGSANNGQQNVQGSNPPNVGFGVSTQKPVFHFGANPVPANANAPVYNNNNRPSFGFNPIPISNAPMPNNNNTPSFGFGPVSVANAPSTNNNPSFGFGAVPGTFAPATNIPSFGFGGQPATFPPATNNNNNPSFGFAAPNAPVTNNNNNPIFGALPVSNSGGFSFGGSSQSTPDQSDTSDEIPVEEQFLNYKKRYMFLARVLVGRSCTGRSGMRKPSRDDQNRPLNSACDNTKRPSIFVIFDSAQCYPEYLIELA